MKEESKLIELFKKYPGIAARIRRSFAYHYDQIQREIESEVATINKDDAATIIDYTTEYMEESMNWPDPDNQTNLQQAPTYPKQIKIQTEMKKNQLLIDNLRTHILQSLENLEELLEQEDINLRTLRIKELEISFTVTRRTKSEYLKSLDFWYNPLTNYKEYQIPLQK